MSVGSLLLLMAVSPAAASPARMEEAVQTIPNPQISVTNLRGQIVVRGWDKLHVHVLCITVSPRVEVDVETMPHSGAAERVQLATYVLDPLVTGEDETANCTLEVPREASLEIRNRQGNVQIEQVRGQHVWVETAGGGISAQEITGHLTARSLGGDIEIVRPSGRVEAFSITGAIRFVEPTSKNLRGNTNSGTITYHGDFIAGANYVLSTYSGDMDVVCPAAASFELNAKSVKGKIDNTVSLTPKRHHAAPLAFGNSLLGTHNTGNAMVELTSFSGTIRIRQQR